MILCFVALVGCEVVLHVLALPFSSFAICCVVLLVLCLYRSCCLDWIIVSVLIMFWLVSSRRALRCLGTSRNRCLNTSTKGIDIWQR